MSNFEIFDRDYITTTLNLFNIDSLDGFTPIRYEALTPDRFIWLFRANYEGVDDQFFVVFQDDSIQKMDIIHRLVESWANTKITKFIKPSNSLAIDELEHFTDPSLIDTDVRQFASKKGDYLTLLALVEKPNSRSYWTNSITLRPGDDIRKMMPPEMSSQVRESTIKSIQEALFRPWVKEREIIPPNMHLSLYHDPQTGNYDFFYLRNEDSQA
jgi:hypothetical protein